MGVGLEISTSDILGNEVSEKPKRKAIYKIEDIVSAISDNRFNV